MFAVPATNSVPPGVLVFKLSRVASQRGSITIGDIYPVCHLAMSRCLMLITHRQAQGTGVYLLLCWLDSAVGSGSEGDGLD